MSFRRSYNEQCTFCWPCYWCSGPEDFAKWTRGKVANASLLVLCWERSTRIGSGAISHTLRYLTLAGKQGLHNQWWANPDPGETRKLENYLVSQAYVACLACVGRLVGNYHLPIYGKVNYL